MVMVVPENVGRLNTLNGESSRSFSSDPCPSPVSLFHLSNTALTNTTTNTTPPTTPTTTPTFFSQGGMVHPRTSVEDMEELSALLQVI